MAGFELAFKGRSLAALPNELAESIAQAGGESVVLGLRRGDPGAVDEALAVIGGNSAQAERRQRYLEILGEISNPKALPLLLKLLGDPQKHFIHPAALT